mmetsp:Transcript_51444/g.123748  ORF Transcript_51444/g.123748 Transcript_51444/m.123748 type:complete len:207 (-) Transcript_51444:456-1076(-)
MRTPNTNKKKRGSPNPAQPPHLALGERKAEDIECLGGVLGVAGRSDCRDALLHQPSEGHLRGGLALGAGHGLHLGVAEDVDFRDAAEGRVRSEGDAALRAEAHGLVVGAVEARALQACGAHAVVRRRVAGDREGALVDGGRHRCHLEERRECARVEVGDADCPRQPARVSGLEGGIGGGRVLRPRARVVQQDQVGLLETQQGERAL